MPQNYSIFFTYANFYENSVIEPQVLKQRNRYCHYQAVIKSYVDVMLDLTFTCNSIPPVRETSLPAHARKGS